MTELPTPLTPADCDLTGYRFMPLDVVRLKGSELASSYSPEACWAAMLLWCASWQQIPAGSIPDNDEWIAKQAGYSVRGKIDRTWKNVRAGAMHGWVKCSDGLLYHPTVSEKALEGWIGKLVSRLAGGIGNSKRWGTEFDASTVKAQIIEACAHLQSIAPQSEMLTKKQIIAILAGSPPDKNNVAPRSDIPSPPDGKSVAPRQLDLSPPDRNRDGDGEGDIKTIKTSHTSSSVSDAQAKDRDDSILPKSAEKPKRHIAIAVLLRNLGVRPMTASHPLAIEWGANEKVTDALLTEAMEDARRYKPTGDVSPNYLAPILADKLNPPAAKVDNAWKRTDAGIDAKGRELGMQPRPKDSYAEYRARIEDELRKRAQQKPDHGEAA